MNGQHQYEINLKKDDLFINLSSDDVYFISKQMDKWFAILLDDSYVPVSAPPRPPAPAPVAEAPQPEPTPAPVMEAPPAVPVPQPTAEAAASAQEPASVPASEPPPQAVEPQPAPPALEPDPTPQPHVQQPVPPAAEAPLPAPAPQPAPQPQAAATPMDAEVEDDFEAVMDSLMKDFEDDAPQQAAPMPPAPQPMPTANGNGGNGYHAAAPDLSMIESLADLCDRSHAGNSEDYLLLSAYFLTYFEGHDKFSLKKVNSMLVKSGLTPVNHSVLETSLSRGYLEMVPDLTGTAEVSEYVLTGDGQGAANRLL